MKKILAVLIALFVITVGASVAVASPGSGASSGGGSSG